MSDSQTIGIFGAGKLGIVLAQLALKAGFRVLIAGAGDPSKIALAVEVLAPGAIAASSSEVVNQADIIILAIPLGKYTTLNPQEFRGKLVIDAMNYWWEADGIRDDLTNSEKPTSELVQAFLKDARVVKAFNHMGYHDLFDENRPEGEAGRKAIAVAGNNEEDTRTVMNIVNQLGFDPVYVGGLHDTIRMQPGSPVFGANVNKSTLIEMLS